MICICCDSYIDENTQEFNEGTDKGNNKIFMCEECLDYSNKSFEYFKNRDNKKEK